jgi:hypothetical protein
MAAVVPSGVFGQPAVAAPAAAVAQAPVVEDKITIVEGDSKTCFFVCGLSKGSPLKKTIKAMGGIRNARVQGYKFPARDLDLVCSKLGVEKNVNLVDPRQTIQLEFNQKVQWPGDMAEAEKRLTAVGLTKKAGNGNVWVGDLSQAGTFLQAFGISQSK